MYFKFPRDFKNKLREVIKPIIDKKTTVNWKDKSFKSKVKAPFDIFILSLVIKYNCMGSPPLEDGVIPATKNPAKAYL